MLSNNNAKKALIIGVSGQDGYYLAKLLLKKGYAVFGVSRKLRTIPDDLKKLLTGAYEADLSASGVEEELAEYVKHVVPDEIYYLAAHHFSSQTDENRKGRVSPFLRVNLLLPNLILEMVLEHFVQCRFFYASSAQIFGSPASSPQNETTPYDPDTPYAISKCTGNQLCKYYREKHGLYTSVGILFNHESPRRADAYVTTKISHAAAMASLGRKPRLSLFDLNAEVDWGSAQDYVLAMWKTMQQESGGEYIIATGVPRKVSDFVQTAFKFVGLDPSEYVFQSTEKAKEASRNPYIGNPSLIKKRCGWEPVMSFEQMVQEMVDEQVVKIVKNKEVAP